MKEGDRYLKIIEWSDEDQCYVGTCPELFGGGCHGDDEAKVYKELCGIVDWVIETNKEDGIPLPEPKKQTQYSGKFVMRVGPELHKILAYRALIANESLNNYCLGVLREDVAEYNPDPSAKPKKTTIPSAKIQTGKMLPYPRGKGKGVATKKINP